MSTNLRVCCKVSSRVPPWACGACKCWLWFPVLLAPPSPTCIYIHTCIDTAKEKNNLHKLAAQYIYILHQHCQRDMHVHIYCIMVDISSGYYYSIDMRGT